MSSHGQDQHTVAGQTFGLRLGDGWQVNSHLHFKVEFRLQNYVHGNSACPCTKQTKRVMPLSVVLRCENATFVVSHVHTVNITFGIEEKFIQPRTPQGRLSVLVTFYRERSLSVESVKTTVFTLATRLQRNGKESDKPVYRLWQAYCCITNVTSYSLWSRIVSSLRAQQTGK